MNSGAGDAREGSFAGHSAGRIHASVPCGCLLGVALGMARLRRKNVGISPSGVGISRSRTFSEKPLEDFFDSVFGSREGSNPVSFAPELGNSISHSNPQTADSKEGKVIAVIPNCHRLAHRTARELLESTSSCAFVGLVQADFYKDYTR